ncbi:MAG: thiamine phosphate synthase, partial [Bacilli bacterium]
MKKSTRYETYLVTDSSIVPSEQFLPQIEAILAAGIDCLQLREKNVDSRTFYETARTIKALCNHYHTTFLINDRVDIALAVDADGVHVGQSDLRCDVVRSILGKDKIIGVSVHTLHELQTAIAQGADYVGAGALFPSVAMMKVKNNATTLS